MLSDARDTLEYQAKTQAAVMLRDLLHSSRKNLLFWNQVQHHRTIASYKFPENCITMAFSRHMS